MRSSSHTLGIDVLRTCKGVLNSLDCTYLAGRERILDFLSDSGATTEIFRSFTLGDVGEKSRSLLALSGDRIIGELLFLSSSFFQQSIPLFCLNNTYKGLQFTFYMLNLPTTGILLLYLPDV